MRNDEITRNEKWDSVEYLSREEKGKKKLRMGGGIPRSCVRKRRGHIFEIGWSWFQEKV